MRTLSGNKTRKVAVYSGSFNPLHIGHLAIMKHLAEGGCYDAVYLIVSPKNPLKDSIDSRTGLQRYQAAVEAVQRHFSSASNTSAKIVVDDIELKMPEPHYTIRTLDALKERESDNDFTLVMGADSLDNIRRWKDYKRILKEYGIAVYPRAGFCLTDIKKELLEEDNDYKIEILDAPEITVSSTDIRHAVSTGSDIAHLLM